MVARRTPWAVVVASVLSVVVAAGAVVASVLVREHRAESSRAPERPTTVTSTPLAPNGCRVAPCRVMAVARVAGTTVELVADAGAKSGRLRIGGPSSSEVIEMTVTDLGVTLTPSSLQCVARALSACVVRGTYEEGTAGQVVVSRSGKWSSLNKPFLSRAGYLALAEVSGSQSGPEVIAAQYACVQGDAAECAGEPVYAQVFAVGTATEVGCTRNYDDVRSLPGYPLVTLTDDELSTC